MSVLVYTVAGGLIVAAIVAATTLAVRDLNTYARLLRSLGTIAMAFLIAILAVSMVGLYRAVELLHLLQESNLDVEVGADSIRWLVTIQRITWWSVLIVIALTFYLSAIAPRIAGIVQERTEDASTDIESPSA